MQGFAPTRRVLHLTLVKILKIPGKPSPVFIAFFITTKSPEILGSSLLSADWNKADVSWWQKNVIWILLVDCLVGLSLTKKVWLSDQPYMTVVVYHGHLTTTWQQPILPERSVMNKTIQLTGIYPSSQPRNAARFNSFNKVNRSLDNGISLACHLCDGRWSSVLPMAG